MKGEKESTERISMINWGKKEEKIKKNEDKKEKKENKKRSKERKREKSKKDKILNCSKGENNILL